MKSQSYKWQTRNISYLVASHFARNFNSATYKEDRISIDETLDYPYYYKNIEKAIDESKSVIIKKEDLKKLYIDEEFKYIKGTKERYIISNYGRSFNQYGEELFIHKEKDRKERVIIKVYSYTTERFMKKYVTITYLVASHFLRSFNPDVYEEKEIRVDMNVEHPYYYKNIELALIDYYQRKIKTNLIIKDKHTIELTLKCLRKALAIPKYINRINLMRTGFKEQCAVKIINYFQNINENSNFLEIKRFITEFEKLKCRMRAEIIANPYLYEPVDEWCNGSKAILLTNEQKEELISRYYLGEKKAYDRLYVASRGLCYKIAGRIAVRYPTLSFLRSDICSTGLIALANGIKRFDLNNNVKFNTYIAKCIKNEVLRFIMKSITVYNYEMLTSPSFKENNCRNNYSLDLIESRELNYDQMLENKTPDFEELLSLVPGEKERKVLIYTFKDKMSQQEIASKMNCSQPQISRMNKKSFVKIKAKIEARERRYHYE